MIGVGISLPRGVVARITAVLKPGETRSHALQAWIESALEQEEDCKLHYKDVYHD